jgi:uncharacterized membrane protein
MATDIDEQGRVVGFDNLRDGLHAMLWTPATTRGTTGSLTALADLGGTQGYAEALNDVGQIAGGSSDGANFHATVWDGGTPHALTEPAGAATGAADGISDQLLGGNRLVVGRADFPTTTQAAVWRVSGAASSFSVLGVEVLPGLRPDGAGQATAANSSGLIVGDALITGSDFPRPAEWSFSSSKWTIIQLAVLPGQDFGQVLDVNASGAAVGHNGQAGVAGCNHGAVWPPNTLQPRALQDLAGGSCSVAWAINDAGQITGSARDSRGRNQAVLWLPTGAGSYSILNLGNPPGSLSSEGRGLNEPQADGSGGVVLEVVGASGSRATLWKVRLP